MNDPTPISEAPTRVAPVGKGQRMELLDTIRGVAVLGILVMNAVSYGLSNPAYFNIGYTAPQSPLDWVLGAVGEVFFDQKFMGLFSMLFGAGIVLFADRLAGRGKRPAPLSLWRNTLLLGIGLIHAWFWDGDVLVVYALCAPLLILLRTRSIRFLATLGVASMLVSPIGAVIAQSTIDSGGVGLGDYWGDTGEMSAVVGLWLLSDFFSRAFGMMLLGVVAYRTGFLTGGYGDYRRVARWGLGIGLPLSAAGFAMVAASGFSPEVALVGSIPNTLATVPLVAAYVALIALWHERTQHGSINARVRSVGRMALTNYLSQTALGLLVLRNLLGDVELTRTGIAIFVVAVWALQLTWSQTWLSRHAQGPVEWLWRAATYRRLPPRA